MAPAPSSSSRGVRLRRTTGQQSSSLPRRTHLPHGKLPSQARLPRAQTMQAVLTCFRFPRAFGNMFGVHRRHAARLEHAPSSCQLRPAGAVRLCLVARGGGAANSLGHRAECAQRRAAVAQVSDTRKVVEAEPRPRRQASDCQQAPCGVPWRRVLSPGPHDCVAGFGNETRLGATGRGRCGRGGHCRRRGRCCGRGRA